MRLPQVARVAVAVVAIAVTASCASGTAPAPEPAPASTATQPTTNHGAYAICLAENGVPTPPAGPGAPPGVDEKTWATAQKACADKAPGAPG